MSPLFLHDSPLPLRRLLLGLLAGGILISIIGYTLFQARLLITGPSVTLSEPPPTIQHERVVTLAGTARNISHITLNGRTIYTDERGYFEEALVLENGYTIATVEARDRYGRVTQVTHPFVYLPATLLPL